MQKRPVLICEASLDIHFVLVATVEHGVPLMMPKWDQHRGPTRKVCKTRSQSRRWEAPSPPKDGQDTPGPREGSGWPPGPTSPHDVAPDKVAFGFPCPAGGRTTPGASFVLKRIRTPMRALGARRLGLQEEERSLGLSRWGCQRNTSTFPKG